MSDTVEAPIDFHVTLDRYMEAFNANDLDRVMTHFAEDAIYWPGDGSEHHGLAAIRRELAPQFGGEYGSMFFDEHERLFDDAARKAVVRYVCRHDLAGFRSASLVPWLRRIAVSLTIGRRFGWEGVDVFHFDAAGKIHRKWTYSNYSRPQLRQDLGAAR